MKLVSAGSSSSITSIQDSSRGAAVESKDARCNLLSDEFSSGVATAEPTSISLDWTVCNCKPINNFEHSRPGVTGGAAITQSPVPTFLYLAPIETLEQRQPGNLARQHRPKLETHHLFCACVLHYTD